MPAAAVCVKCGRSLTLAAPAGLCPRCLLVRALETKPEGRAVEGSGAADDPLGTIRYFGDYGVVAELGRGGMGVVYEARQISLNRRVALKVMLSGEWASPQFVERFRAEAETAASLDHPNIVPIYEVGEHQGQHYFSMKLIEGVSLAERIAHAGNKLTLRGSALLIAKLARAVHFAHQRGVLHRDLKPANVLVDENDEPYLLDFGLAKLIEKESKLTRTFAVLGTPAYISPEQAAGKTKDLTTATDVYGLGAMLYELLTGNPPFGGGTTVETIRQVLEKEPRRPSFWNPATDRDLETICLTCLEKEPSRRYGSAEALAHDLQHWLLHEPIQARPTGAWERAKKWICRRPAVAGLVATAVTALLTVTVVSTVMGLRIARARQIIADRAEEGRQQLVRLNTATGNQLVEQGDFSSALLWLAEALRLEAGHPGREEVHRRRFACLLRQTPWIAQLTFHDAGVNSARFNPNGQLVVTASDDKTALILDTATGRPIVPPLRHEAPVLVALFSPDGSHVGTTSADGTASVWEARTGKRLASRIPQNTRLFKRPLMPGLPSVRTDAGL
ncbi:MAG: serine/threonine-protein kinase [Verrucomicrobiales bacterium]|nr:serine/threonine-protein kinase [Verrucomicrobiales bacterium]